ncbi:Dam family site-specific DNA-(adenine-N6)-methyltransferase [Parasphaerochaeta coccoides]|uniref:Site-specific DNA-methyltransferase (adenine-specific) n=1 Tax=Parasphaerochaeta coccoides (strain ATCC BAA-1237 / DSM 17374 / SPN1) TaxID=760011 RepID=F4GK08_PARC1|nr:Dam family site-specific DNA-(adenine-N6)-methyltransferase [Parasphaerochaeta coccoides]AEC01780.1 DNA adenine methylase [Parasphaerochaeta coccoides DSM 17374]
MDFMTAKEASALWGISQRRVALLCSENRIDGAEMMGKMWLIPNTATKPDDARSLRFQPLECLPVKPFVKWAGGKAQILDEIRRLYPSGLGATITKYAEPFVGGGAVLFDILSKYQLDEIYISDINRELIATYTHIRDDVGELVDALRTMEQEYIPASDDDRKEYYYEKRERFNHLKAESDTSVEVAALFIYLNRTCFNGLYRVNSKGGFNVPMGSYKNPTICDENNLAAVSERLQNVEIVCGDYKESWSFIDKRTFAYFDPPYRPLSDTASFTSYAQDGFDDDKQEELARFIKELSRKGAYVVASNSDPKNTNEGDNFFDELYNSLSIARISASRTINSVGDKRGRVSELLISNCEAIRV